MEVFHHSSFIFGMVEHYQIQPRRNYGMKWRTYDPRKLVLPVNTKHSWQKLSRFEKISGVKNKCRFYTALSHTFKLKVIRIVCWSRKSNLRFFVSWIYWRLELIFFPFSKDRLEVQSVGLFQAKEECSKLKVQVFPNYMTNHSVIVNSMFDLLFSADNSRRSSRTKGFHRHPH